MKTIGRGPTWQYGLVLLVAGALATVASVAVSPTSHAHHRTIVGGTLTADTTWTAAGNSYLVDSTVHIPAGVTLRIEPGVYIAADEGVTEMFLVQGTLVATGTAQAPVFFNPDYSSPDLFALRDAPSAVVRLSQARVKGVDSVFTGVDGQANGQVLVSDSTFDTYRSLGELYPAADSLFERNYFVGADLRVRTAGSTQVVFRGNGFVGGRIQQSGAGTEPTLLTENTFYRAGMVLEIAEGVPSARMDAPGNYWGTTDRSVIDQQILDRNDSTTRADVIEYDPIRTESGPDIPPDATPSNTTPLPPHQPVTTATPSSTASTTPTPAADVSLTVDVPVITAGNTPQLAGRVVDVNGTGLPGVMVTLYRAVYGGTGATAFATVTTGSDGFFSSTVAPTQQTKYDARVDGVISPSVLVRVHSRLTVSSPQPGTTVGTRTTFHGSLIPVYPGAAIGLAVIQNGRYRYLGQSRLLADGTFAITATLPVGSYPFVVYTSARSGTLYGSKSLTLHVR